MGYFRPISISLLESNLLDLTTYEGVTSNASTDSTKPRCPRTCARFGHLQNEIHLFKAGNSAHDLRELRPHGPAVDRLQPQRYMRGQRRPNTILVLLPSLI